MNETKLRALAAAIRDVYRIAEELGLMVEHAPVDPHPLPPDPVLPPPVVALPRVVTSVKVNSTSDVDQENVPITFGQVFAPGDVPVGSGLVGAGVWQIPIQMDVKATHPDGTVRHAVVSAILPMLAARAKLELALAVVSAPSSAPILGAAIPYAWIALVVDGITYRTTANNAQIDDKDWLSGSVVSEWKGRAPLRAADGTEHPHLSARFGVRFYEGKSDDIDDVTRVEVVIENDWAYEPNPQNFVYDVEIAVAGEVVYKQAALEHYHHARWRKVFWTGGAEPAVHIEHDAAYLIRTRALPNYDLSVKVRETTLAKYVKDWNDSTVGPMKSGPLVEKGMSTTGGRQDIGLLPGWAASYLISQDERAKRVTLGTSEMAGSFPIHYRDKGTDLPISVIDYPYMTILGNPGDTNNPNRVNPATGKKGMREAFPALAKATSKTPYGPDSSHQPAFSYLAYLVSGEHYHLEELQFWAMWNILQANPGYRKQAQGLLHPNQVRGQAWSMRTLAEAAYITPDGHPLKSHFKGFLDNNLDWYIAEYPDNLAANKLGVIVNGAAATGYKDGTDEPMPKTAVSPWQDAFFTQSIGHVADLFPGKADRLLAYKAQFPIGTMVGEGVCWLAAAEYAYVVRATEDGPIYETFAEAYRDTVGDAVAALPCGDQVAAALGQKPNDMGGYPGLVTGYPANLQPALAYAAGTGPEGRRAWDLFMSRTTKPDYGISPQFAILPW